MHVRQSEDWRLTFVDPWIDSTACVASSSDITPSMLISSFFMNCRMGADVRIWPDEKLCAVCILIRHGSLRLSTRRHGSWGA
jgi:hypothetical protein